MFLNIRVASSFLLVVAEAVCRKFSANEPFPADEAILGGWGMEGVETRGGIRHS